MTIDATSPETTGRSYRWRVFRPVGVIPKERLAANALFDIQANTHTSASAQPGAGFRSAASMELGS